MTSKASEIAGKIVYTLGLPDVRPFAWSAFELVCRRAKEGAKNAIAVKACIKRIADKLRGM